MKPRRNLFLGSFLAFAMTQASNAASATWDGDTSGFWNNSANWSAAFPNTSGDIATFNANVPNSVITLGQDITITSIRFDTANCEAYTFNNTANKFILGGSGDITVNSTVTTTQTINTNLQLGGNGAAATYNIVNNSTTGGQLLTYGGGITGGSGGTAGVKVLAVAGGGNVNLNGVISNGGATNVSLTKSGAGILTLSNTNTYTGTTTISGGTLTVGTGGVINNVNTAGGTGSINGGAILRIDGGTAKFNTAAAGDTGLQVGTTTAGNVVVTNNGTLAISTGRLILGGSSAGSGTSTFTQDSGTTTVASNLYTANYNATDMFLSGGNFTVSGSSVLSQRANTNFNISGTANVNFNAQVTLGGQAGTYDATINLDGGTLSVVNIANAANGNTTFNFNGGILKAKQANADFLNADFVYVKAGGATINTDGFDVTIDNALLQSGVTTGALTKSGAGTLTLTATNTYTGGSTINGGMLQFGKTLAVPTTGAIAVNATGVLGASVGGAGEFSSASSGAGSVGALFAGATFANGAGYGIDTTNAGADVDYSGNFGGTGMLFVSKAPTANKLTLSGTGDLSGGLTIRAGTFQPGSNITLGGALVMANDTATFDLNGRSFSFTNLTTGSANNTITTTAAGSGTDTLTITGLTAASGALFTDNGTRKLALSLDGTPTLDPLSNASNTFSGGLSMANMRLAAVNNSAVTGGRYGKGTITIGTASQVYFNSANVTISNDFVVNSAAGNGSRAGSFRVDTTGNTLAGQITASGAAATFNVGGGTGAIALTGKITGSNGLTVNNASNLGTAITVTLNNASANNDYQGTTTVANTTATLKLGAANQIPNGTGTGNVSLAGTLDLNGYSETINGLTGAGTIDNVLATGGASNTLTIGDNNANGNTFTGIIKNTAGSLAVVKIGSGTQSLQTGVSTFSGGLTIKNGTIIALNSTVLGGAGGNSGAITLGDTTGNNSASLLIQGSNLTISNPVTLATNGSVGALTIGATASASGATAFGGGVTGTNNLTLANGSASTLTFQTAAINSVGTVTNAGAGSGSTSIAIGFGSNVTDIIQNSTTSALSIASGVASTNTGSTYIKAGTLQLNGPGGGTAITPVNNGTIYLGDTINSTAATLALGNTNNLANAIVVQSNGNASTKAINVSSSGVPVYSGGITLNDNLDITTASTAGLTIQTGDVTINNNSTLAFKPSGTNAGTFTISSKITGAGGKVEFAGTTSASPTYIITAANDYTGTTTISKGTLRIGNNTTTGSLSPSSAITNNAAMVFNRTNATVQGTDFANNITGTGSVTLGSGGTYTFTANAFQGGMTLSGASATQLNINAATALGTGTFTISSGDSAKIDNTSGSLVTLNNNAQAWNNNFEFVGSNALNMGTGAVSMGGTRTLTISANTLTVGGAISGSGFGITKRGAGTLVLSGATTSDYTGTVTLGVTNGTDGILVLGKDSALGTSAGGLVITGGNQTGGVQLTGSITISDAITFEGRQTSTQGDFISNLSGNNIVAGLMTGGIQGNNYNIGSQAGLIDFQGGITTSQSGRSLNLRGAGDGKISGAIANTGSGTIGIRLQGSGIWELSAANTHVGSTSIAGAGTLKLTNNLALQNSALDTTYTGGGTVDFSLVNTPTIGGLTSAGALAMPANVTSLTLNVAGTQTHTGDLSGSTAMQLVKTGAGTQVLGGSNSYSGATTITGGVLQVAHNNALGTTSGVTMTANNSLQLANGITVTGRTITITGYGASVRGALQVAANSSAEWAGTVKLGSGDSRVGALGNGILTLSGVIENDTGNTFIVSAQDAASATPGKVIVSGTSNTYTGQTQIFRGTLAIGADNALPTGTVLNVHSASGIGDTAVFDLNNYNQQVAGLTRGNTSGPAIVTNTGVSSKTLTINNSTPYSFDSAITGNLALIKSGAGIQTLTGTNTYTGTTAVNGGKLIIGSTGSIAAASAVSVSNAGSELVVDGTVGGTLVANANTIISGSGTISDAVNLAGTLRPGQGGSGDRSLTINGNVTTTAGSKISFTVTNMGAANHDQLVIGTGSSIGLNNADLEVSFDPLLTFDILGAGQGDDFLAALDTYTGTGSWFKLIDGETNGTMFANVTDTMSTTELSYFGLSGTQYKTNIGGQAFWVAQGSTYLVAIPEPRAALLGGLGMLMLLRRRRVA